MRLIGLAVVLALDCYRNGDDGIYRSHYARKAWMQAERSVRDVS